MRVAVPGGTALSLTAAELEEGTGLEGALGNGEGKWRLVVEASHLIGVMNLLRSSSSGHITNLSTVSVNERDGVHMVPLFPSASDGHGRQGFVRVINRTDDVGTIRIAAFDDSDWSYELLTMAVGANEAMHFNSVDLELGNGAKGLTGSTGPGWATGA